MSILEIDPTTLNGFNNLNCYIIYSYTTFINIYTNLINVGDVLNAITFDVTVLEADVTF